MNTPDKLLNHLTPLELLNLYLSEGKSVGSKESRLYQKFNRELTWDAMLNEGYQADLAPLLHYIITKTYTCTLKPACPVESTYSTGASPEKTSTTSPGPSVHSTQSSSLSFLSSAISPEVLQKLETRYKEQLVNNLIQFNELDKILNVFEKEGVDVIQLKGADLAKNYFPDQALRPMEDIDLLVRETEIKRACEYFISNGYELVKHLTFENEDDYEEDHFHFPYVKHFKNVPMAVEIHQDIARNESFINHNISEIWRNHLHITDNHKHIFKLDKEIFRIMKVNHAFF
ncbi:MAG: nucleotidyltransferase family protein [Candidatus Brocadiaceae bacterium]|nr:nucleotidyltransferase family protein [Candidatus Brocadiaceae bacterium]